MFKLTVKDHGKVIYVESDLTIEQARGLASMWRKFTVEITSY